MRGGGSLVVTLFVGIVVAACGTSLPAESGAQGTSATSRPSGRSASLSASADPTTANTTSDPAASDATSTPAGSGSPGPTPKPVAAVKGTGFVDSKRFTLEAGNYIVRWRLVSSDAAGCTAIGAIHTPDGTTSVEVANTSVKGNGSRSGSKGAPKLPAGSYLVTFATICSWTANVFKA